MCLCLSSLIIFVFSFIFCGNISSVDCISSHPIVFIISVDGFRYDYVEECLTPTISSLRRKGVYAQYMKNVFPTKTLPNHYSIATGVYPGIHGVLDSEVYISKDGCSNRTVLGYSYELFHYNNDILPIWTLNQLAGRDRHSGVMMWPGGDFSYGCKKTFPTFYQGFNVNISFEKRVDTVMSWITHPDTPANLVLLYLEEPDLHGHAYGINTYEVRDQIKKVDNILKYIHQKLEDYKLTNDINVFVVSDHGMINLDQRNIIDLNKFVDNSSYVSVSLSPVLQIFPKLGHEDAVLLAFQEARQKNKNAMDVYMRDDIPNVWQYRQNNRTPPVLVVAKEGFAFQDMYNSISKLNKEFNIEPNPRNKYGIHGYSNDIKNMFPIFFAWGPLLKTDIEIEPFNSVDLYPTWAHILNLKLEDFDYSPPILSMLSVSFSNASQTLSDSEIMSPSTQATLTAIENIEGAATWTYWGIFAIVLVVAIFGVSAHYIKDIRCRNGLDGSLHPLSHNHPCPCHSQPCPCRCHFSPSSGSVCPRHGARYNPPVPLVRPLYYDNQRN